MPYLIAALGSLLLSVFKWLIGRIFALIGFGYVVYQGIKPLYDNLINAILDTASIQNAEMMPIKEWLGVLKVDVCLSIIISAIGLKILLMGLNAAGGLKKARLGGD